MFKIKISVGLKCIEVPLADGKNLLATEDGIGEWHGVLENPPMKKKRSPDPITFENAFKLFSAFEYRFSFGKERLELSNTPLGLPLLPTLPRLPMARLFLCQLP